MGALFFVVPEYPYLLGVNAYTMKMLVSLVSLRQGDQWRIPVYIFQFLRNLVKSLKNERRLSDYEKCIVRKFVIVERKIITSKLGGILNG